ncbi:DNA-formamidopyrimidine glycosylase [Chromatiales bacterium (ex Bugula neritina AB1)]|nr:DNA-formamidopyrimidine glycosylase [Chromatiales bacterium (ex Bugula neritina AB1)]
MPELPEVETTLRGIAPQLLTHQISSVDISQPQLRWPVSKSLTQLKNSKILSLHRRAKYLLIETEHGHLIIHLGMSGSLRINDPKIPRKKHDHIEFRLSTGKVLRYHDPRRFGAVLFTTGEPSQHKLLISLGPEPLSEDFNASHLFKASRNRKRAVKNLIMDGHIVVGVGNIYASEALFLAGIRPGIAASRLTSRQCNEIVDAIKKVLAEAISMGGTTLRDFVNSDGEPGYFQQTLNVYGRQHEPCLYCTTRIKQKVIGQRSTFYCPSCQK